MLNLNVRAQRGLSLIELMVSIVIGLIVVLGAIQVYITTARGGIDSTRSNRLTQDLRAVLGIMMDDVRRAGHMADPTALATNPFTVVVGGRTDLLVTANCVRYSYDATWNGGAANVVDAGTDFAGFRYAGNAVQFMVSTTNNSTANCNDDLGWENVTDPSVVNVTAMSFDVVGSKCIYFVPTAYDENDATTYTSWSTTSGTTSACTAGSPGAPSSIPAGQTLIEVRNVRISITAQHASDPTLTRTLADTVTLRNHRVFTN